MKMVMQQSSRIKIKPLHQFVKFTLQIMAILATKRCFNSKVYRLHLFILVEDEQQKMKRWRWKEQQNRILQQKTF